MADKAIRSVLDYRKMFNRIHYDPETDQVGLLTPINAIVEYQKKVFRGLFYYQYRLALPKECKMGVDLGINEKRKTHTARMIKYYQGNFPVKHSGSPHVFRYILQPFRKGLNQAEKKDLILEVTDTQFVGIHVFNNCFTSVVYANVSS